MVTWRLKTYLDENNVSAYALAKAADVAPNTVYALARGDHKQVSLKVLDEIMEALDGLTGKRATISDLLERQ